MLTTIEKEANHRGLTDIEKIEQFAKVSLIPLVVKHEGKVVQMFSCESISKCNEEGIKPFPKRICLTGMYYTLPEDLNVEYKDYCFVDMRRIAQMAQNISFITNPHPDKLSWEQLSPKDKYDCVGDVIRIISSPESEDNTQYKKIVRSLNNNLLQ